MSATTSNVMDEYSKVLDRLQGQCSKREYCCSDVFRKAMTAFEGNRELSQKLVDELVADRFVDDLRYASAFAREKSRLSGWGPVKIACMLAGKGIAGDIVKEALEGIDADDAEHRMRTVLEAKYKTLKGDPHEKFKLLKFGLARGYDYDTIAPVVDGILGKNR